MVSRFGFLVSMVPVNRVSHYHEENILMCANGLECNDDNAIS